MSELTMASLFDGSGGFPLAALMNGIVPKWSSEIEPFPIRVTAKRMPFITHYGDVCKIKGDEVKPVDIITFGSPCQDMSIAGKRNGLGAERSGLFYEAIRIVKEMRRATNGEYPKYIVWENVPGAFSSQKGQDFRAVLEEIVRVKDETLTVPMPENGKWLCAGEIVGDGYSVAWRTVDAQYFGVAQRRRRIYLVADFRGECAGKILFEFEGLSGYHPQSFRAWEGTPEDAQRCTDSAISVENHGQDGRYRFQPDGKTQTLSANMRNPGNAPLVLKKSVPEAKVYGVCAKSSNAMKSDNPKSGFYEAETTRTLDNTGGNPTCNQGGMAVVCLQGSMIGRKEENGPQGDGINKDKSFTLNATDKHAVVYAISRPAFNCGKAFAGAGLITDDGITSTLVAAGPSAVGEPYSFYPQMKAESQSFREGVANTIVNGTNPGYQNGIVENTYAVRRLTPSECAMLQGFPWWWAKGLEIEEPTDEEIAFWQSVFETYGKPKSEKQIRKWLQQPGTDSAEYKMWGNGIALPCAAFVFAGIKYFS